MEARSLSPTAVPLGDPERGRDWNPREREVGLVAGRSVDKLESLGTGRASDGASGEEGCG